MGPVVSIWGRFVSEHAYLLSGLTINCVSLKIKYIPLSGGGPGAGRRRYHRRRRRRSGHSWGTVGGQRRRPDLRSESANCAGRQGRDLCRSTRNDLARRRAFGQWIRASLGCRVRPLGHRLRYRLRPPTPVAILHPILNESSLAS